MTQKYFAIPTAAGEAAIANAQLTGKALKYTHMSVGDGGGDNAPVPTPNRDQKALIGERHRVQINRLFRDPTNSAMLIIEAVLPSDIGGWWIRELGVWDESGQLAIVGSCAPSFKPLLPDGATRDQVLRVALVVSGQIPIELKIDPAVVLATRGYVDDGLDKKLDKTQTAVAAAKLATARTISVTGDLTGSVSFDGTKNVSFVGTLAASGVTAGVYGSANAVAVMTVDAKGRVTKAESTSIGNAQTATKLAAARSFSISGGATAAAVNFDGSGNVQMVVAGLDVSKATLGILPVSRGGTGLGTVPAGAFLSGAGQGALVPRTPAQVLEDIQALPRAGGVVSGPVTLGAGSALGSMYGANDLSARTAQILLPDGGGFSTHLATVAGAMKITLPPVTIGKNSMIRLRVDVYEYLDTTTPVSILIQGYVQTTRAWVRCKATIVGGTPDNDMPLRFGSDAAGRACIWLGDVTKSWQYPTVSVSEVHVKYNTPGADLEGWGTGWSVEPVTAFETVAVALSSGNLAFARSDVVNVAGLQDALLQKAPAARILTAGNGLTGGGTLEANRTFTLGTPSAITKDSINSVSTTSHSHQLVVTPADIGAAPAASSIVAGNGLTGGGTLAASRTVALGTPSKLTAGTSNAVQATSHTHELDTQTSATDSTAGRMLLVGAFGLGGGAPGMTAYGFASNFNVIDGANITLTVDKAMANGPLGAAVNAYVGQLRVSRRSLPAGVSVVQELFASGFAWIRYGSGDPGSTTWQDWELNLTDKTINTQSAPNDATAGRILTVGNAFGLGSDNLLGTADLNTVKAPGFYGQNANANATLDRNYPIELAGTLVVGSAGRSITTHTYTVYNTGTTLTRGCYNDAWSKWREQVTSDSLTGSVVFFARNTAPPGWLKANGAAVSVSTYADLASAIYVGDALNATAYFGYRCTSPSSPGTTRSPTGAYIVLPDLRGEFLRGWSDGRNVDAGRSFGTAQADMVVSHDHDLPTSTDANGDRATINDSSFGINTPNNVAPTLGFRAYVDPTGGPETRPRNVALLACIRY